LRLLQAKGGERHVLLDVRERVQFAICALPGALNIPLR
jgi:rhodanese-related sulfurtransferase